jgi:hypothetical protein
MTIAPERMSPEQLDHVRDVVDDGVFGVTVRMLLAHIAAQDLEITALRRRPLRSFDQLGADRLADEVAVLVRRRVIDARSPAADALLDYRNPPSTPRADRLADLEDRLHHQEEAP